MDTHVVESVVIEKRSENIFRRARWACGNFTLHWNEMRRMKPWSLSRGDKCKRLEIKLIYQLHSKAVTSWTATGLEIMQHYRPHCCQLILKRRIWSAFHTSLSGIRLFYSFCCVLWSALNKQQRGGLQLGSSLSLRDHMCLFLHLFLCLSLQPSFCLCLILRVARYVTVTASLCHRKQAGVFPLLRGGWHLVSKGN